MAVWLPLSETAGLSLQTIHSKMMSLLQMSAWMDGGTDDDKTLDNHVAYSQFHGFLRLPEI